MPCPYVHIKLGNIFESSLKNISNAGFKVKYFRDNSQTCLAGEDKSFIKNYMAKEGINIFNAPSINEVFSAEELYTDNVL